MQYKYTLIKEVYYSTKDNGVSNSNNVNTLTDPKTIKGDNIRTLRTNFSVGFKKLDGQLYNISYSGVRVPANNSTANVPPTYKETFVINDGPENSVTGTAVYADTGSSDITNISKTKWIASGTGKLIHVNFATIEYDNSGEKFGYPNSRRIRLFKLELVNDKISFKIQTPAYNAASTVEQTIRSDNTTNNPPIWGLTQIRKITITEDKYNLFTEEQKKNAKLLVSLTGNGVITDKVPPQQTGRYILVFDDFTSISFSTGFNSNYGFGLYKYTGIVNNIKDFESSKINWNSQASGNTETDNWEIILK